MWVVFWKLKLLVYIVGKPLDCLMLSFWVSDRKSKSAVLVSLVSRKQWLCNHKLLWQWSYRRNSDKVLNDVDRQTEKQEKNTANWSILNCGPSAFTGCMKGRGISARKVLFNVIGRLNKLLCCFPKLWRTVCCKFIDR